MSWSRHENGSSYPSGDMTRRIAPARAGLLCRLGLHRFKQAIAKWQLSHVAITLEVRRCKCGRLHNNDVGTMQQNARLLLASRTPAVFTMVDVP